MPVPARSRIAPATLACLALVLGGCTDATPTSAPPVSSPDEPVQEDRGRTTVPEPDAPSEDVADPAPSCRHDALDGGPLVTFGDTDPVVTAVEIARTTHDCAPVVVLAPAADVQAAGIAVAVARDADAPLLLVDGTSRLPAAATSALADWDTERLIAVGLPPSIWPLPVTELRAPLGDVDEPVIGDVETDEAETEALQTVELALRVAEHLGTDRFRAVDRNDAEAGVAALAEVGSDLGLLPLPADGRDAALTLLPDTAQLDPAAEPTAVDEPIPAAWPEPTDTTWLVDPAEGAIAAVASVAAHARDDALLPISADDLRSGRGRTARLTGSDIDLSVLVGTTNSNAGWQLETVIRGEPLPWGGFRLFDGQRMVALYGSVETSALGVLGEQGLDATVTRLREVAAPYDADGAVVVPAFELITTVASASAEPSGDYSRRTPIELLRPWVDRAAEEGLYVLLDLQPGRTDFLTQAREYEELLRHPHVGLALDPEWRLEPDEFHLRQIGSVDAAEVQQVVSWLAELTREARLPQKLLVLHQFRFSMLPDRDTIAIPPELAGVVHMDGQGPLSSKYDTYGAITAGAEDRWLWGWKNFYDEDLPRATPTQVLDLDPLPVLITYQ